MNAIFKKLNFKNEKVIHILNAPDSFKNEIAEVSAFALVNEKISPAAKVEFLLAFVTSQKDLDILIPKAVKAMKEDGLLWFAYPKKSSKKYQCDFNRDCGWAELGELGYEGVRMVAIDEDWSALRFRNATHIKKMKRNFAMSEVGKAKVSGNSQ